LLHIYLLYLGRIHVRLLRQNGFLQHLSGTPQRLNTGMCINIEGNLDTVAPLVSGDLWIYLGVVAKTGVRPSQHLKIRSAEADRLQPGFMFRYQTLSLHNGFAEFSDAKTQALGSLPTNCIHSLSSLAPEDG
jgi:hypothetical protein